MCANISQNARWYTGFLYDVIADILPCTALNLQPNVAINSMFNIQVIQAAFSTLYLLFWSVFYMKKCIRCALTLHRMRVDTRVSYTTLSQRSYHIQHTTYMLMFFQRYILLKASVFYMGKVHSVSTYITQNVRWNTGVLSDDIFAILPCTALYLQPKYSHKLYVQYTSDSSCFFNAIFYCLVVYFTWKRAYGVRLYCRECALIHGCLIRRYRSDIAMHSTLLAGKMEP